MKMSRYAPLLFCLTIFFPSYGWTGPSQQNSFLKQFIHASREKHLAQHPYWKKLLHVRRGWFGREVSEVDGPNFFLSPAGRTNTQAELEATLTAFFEPVPTDPEIQHPQCRFPERYAWLKKQLSFTTSSLPEVPCERFESWRDKLDPQGLSIIFASYYMNNPASMYGHTFLRLHRKGKETQGHLLDYTINFSANTNTSNGFLFALLGLTGGFPGVFSTEPYYVKVQKYNNLESRDLWEYALEVDDAALNRLVRHLWEMGPTFMSYYFLNKNCSYQLLPMLEVARPDLDLSRRFTVRAIPLDTLRAVIDTPNFVTGTTFRPSHLRRMRWSRSLLSTEEQKIAADFTDHPDKQPARQLSTVAPEKRPKVLDAAYDYLRYKTGFYREQKKSIQETEHEILKLRNEFPAEMKEDISLPVPLAPETAHGSGRVGWASGLTRGHSFEEISFRGSLHDLEADPTGFTEGSQLEMFHLRLRYDNKSGRAFVHEGTFVNVKSLTPWEPWVKVPSWGVKIGFDTARDLERAPQDTLYFGVSGRSGLTLRAPTQQKLFWYALVEADSAVGGVFDENYRLGVGASSGLLYQPTPFWRIHASGKYLRYGVGAVGSANILSLVQSVSLKRNWEARLSGERQNHYQELMLQLNRYY